LPALPVHPVPELHDFLEREKLYGHGISLVDLQLLYASLLEDCVLWTHDKNLQQLAKKYGRVDSK
ncbi:MAG: VapC toxin family PIN domain ribonuclease, partial [Deltaproteobacteria bacterium]|nr:VapC toxin family PIN domain ribonuclease [Deltaproteobacteria bacterium]